MDFDDDVHEEAAGDEWSAIGSGKGLLDISDPINISDPRSAYLFMSDDAQDEMQGDGNRCRMKCLNCGKIFRGDILDLCPKCSSPNVTSAD